MDEPSLPLRAEAALTDAELDAFETHMQRAFAAAVPAGGAWRETLAALLLALLLSFVAVEVRVADDLLFLAFLFLIAFAGGLLAMRAALLRRHREARVAARRSTGFLAEPRRFALDADGVAVEGATARAHWSWAAFTDAATDEGLLVLRVGLAHAFAIPLRGFADAETGRAALALAQARIAAARGGG